jgi:murein L,D-transpeptidase YcbB/YkuD
MGALALAAALIGAFPPPPAPQVRAAVVSLLRAPDRVGGEIRRAAATGATTPAVAEFYRGRNWRPLWLAQGRLRPEARTVVAMVADAAGQGLDPSAYAPQTLREAVAAARPDDPKSLARAELALSSAFSAYITDLHRPPKDAAPQFRDPALPGPPDAGAALTALASAPDLAAGLAAVQRMHPIYEGLKGALNSRRAAYGDADPLRPLILANMARARGLPADPGPRYLIVDAAAQRLTVYEQGRPVDAMRVIVGKRGDPTPVLAGLIRYARFHPYWNIPEDVTAKEIAPRVLREGPGFLAREHLEILSDWSDAPRVLDPEEVDWAAVAGGKEPLRVRRLPGEQNILGRVKLMLPNPLGIYLHDTPNKAPFGADRRALSHGCVRLQDAMRLTRRLLGPQADNPPPGPDARVDLARPVPVYITYFTLVAGPDGRLERRADLYGRDARLIEALGFGRRGLQSPS